MVNVLSEKTRLGRDVILSEAKSLHEKHGTSEYTFLLNELPCLNDFCDGERHDAIRAALDAYISARKKHLCLYTEVLETLREIRAQGATIVAYTESLELYSVYRVKMLGLDGVLDYLYTPRNHHLPPGLVDQPTHLFYLGERELTNTALKHTPTGTHKPNPEVLAAILRDIDAVDVRTVYVGDSLVRDISMAQELGLVDVYAAYGHDRISGEYDILEEVSHWTRQQFETERRTEPEDILPSFVLEHSFGELLDLFEFRSREWKD